MEDKDKVSVELNDARLASFNSFMEAASLAQNSSDYDMAETLFKVAQLYSIDTWGPYQWPEAKALLELSDLYLLQDRVQEAEVTWLLGVRILS